MTPRRRFSSQKLEVSAAWRSEIPFQNPCVIDGQLTAVMILAICISNVSSNRTSTCGSNEVHATFRLCFQQQNSRIFLYLLKIFLFYWCCTDVHNPADKLTIRVTSSLLPSEIHFSNISSHESIPLLSFTRVRFLIDFCLPISTRTSKALSRPFLLPR